MSDQAIEIGDKLHIMTRRRFESDLRRHFIGEIVGISGELQLVRGYAIIFNAADNDYEKHPEPRMRVFALGQEGFIVNKIPHAVALTSLEYRVMSGRLVVTDGGKFWLDINEFGSLR